MHAKRCVSALRCHQLPASIASCPRRRQFAFARAGQKGDPSLKTAGNLANVGLGVWGSGSVRGEFEVDPAEEIRSWLPVRVEKGSRWSNLAGTTLFGFSRDAAIPFGCGMCVRKDVALAYRKFCERGGLQITDRKSGALSGGGDTEICFVCCAEGLGVGVFPLLELTHLIPQHRVSEDYIVRFAEATDLSNMLLLYKWQGVVPQSPFGTRTLLSLAKTMLLYHGVERRIRLARVRALAEAHRIIKMDLQKNNNRIYDMTAGVRNRGKSPG